MSYSVAEARANNPMWYFERNYTSLMNLLQHHGLFDISHTKYARGQGEIHIEVVERTRYTLLVEIVHKFQHGNGYLRDLVFKVRLYLDAALAEVIAYQGAHQLKARYPYPNDDMMHPDEKRQANLLLNDWLSTWRHEHYRQFIA